VTPDVVFRAGIVTVCSLLTLAPAARPAAVWAVLLLAAGTFVAGRWPTRIGLLWAMTSAWTAALAVPLTGAQDSPLLPYLLATGVTCGLLRDGRRLVVECGLLAGLLLAGATWPDVTDTQAYFIACAEWVLLSLAIGGLSLWARRRVTESAPRGDYDELRVLLQELRNRTGELPGGLDATSAAEALLLRCAAVCSPDRSALLVEAPGGSFVPLAVRGATRVPWRGPTEQGGALREAWDSRRPVVDRRLPDEDGPRAGSALVAVPVSSDGQRLGLLVMESAQPQAFTPDQVEQVSLIAQEGAARVETALLFEQVRDGASHDERGRLARDVHDGIAQELVVFGYELDDLKVRAAAVDRDLAARVGAVRGDLTRLLSDLRLSITDLKTTLGTDRGLGEALGTYLRAVCSGRDVQLHLVLQESAFRLPGDVEVALLRVAQAFAQEARRAQLTALDVTLIVDAPSARLRLDADCPVFATHLGDIGEFLQRAGARVACCGSGDTHPWIEVVLEGDHHDRSQPTPGAADDSAAGGRPRSDPAGAATGVRAD
jgi:signal transduction histidine kinase